MNCNANKSIGCTVKQCAYHCGKENYCSLDKINVAATTRFVANRAFGQNYFLQTLVLPKSLRSIGYQG
ncbi:MAG: DUF1540 domain-containing protein, partial [Clostridia bacterium]|nr:DUF1540 domain-containing protein [Clostridia bacterium]